MINEFGSITDAEVIRKTGYEEIDQWLYDAVVDPDDTESVINDLSNLYSGETGEALGPSPKGDATEASFEFEVNISISGSVCK